MSVFDDFPKLLKAFGVAIASAKEVADLEDHLQNIEVQDPLPLALVKAERAHREAAEMCSKVKAGLGYPPA